MKKEKKEPRSAHNPQSPDETAPIHGLWSGTISFSLVAIPVRVVKAVEPGRIAFRMLHKNDYSPLERRMICPEDGTIVPPDQIIKGYEIAGGHHITVTKEELETVSPERSRTIEILEFVGLDEVDSLYYDHPYFLVPLKGGEKSYSLLAEAMHRTNKAGIARFVMDEREYLVTVKSRDGALALSTLHYHDEILPEETQVANHEDADEKEKAGIKTSIRKMLAGFAPDKYADDRRQKLVDLLKQKEKKAQVEAPEAEKEPGEAVTDLMAVLERSMRKAKRKE